MKKLFLYILIFIWPIYFITSCSDMNSFHDIYLEKGEKVYAANVDSVYTFGGNQKILLRLYCKSPTISAFEIFWNQKSDSLIVPVEYEILPDSFDIMINNIEEGSYVFDIVTRDKYGNKSIGFEQIANVYGERYFARLINHPYSHTEFADTSVTVFWHPSIDDTEVAVEFHYQDKQKDSSINLIIPVEELQSFTKLDHIDPDYLISYRTLFLPEEEALDTFYTDYAPIELMQIVNVAFNKPCTIREGDVFAPQYGGANAVDGIISNASRYVSSGTGEHWLIIDLLQEYSIYSFKALTGSGGNLGNPHPVFSFQAEIEGEWVDIVNISGNSSAAFETEFPEVTTSKVRYYVPANTVDHVRLYEIEVYSKVKYEPIYE